ncbi:hypothetical protein RI129_000556 [Pyrocoelia pectoralis]|uniref:Uncharacterized protein n=1 Tax=Pyrocoelia pectoralis TaxID=417401 RepID=A0AAN7VJC2_9COLE
MSGKGNTEMFCIIQYLDSTQDEDKDETISMIHPPPSITSIKEENKELLINPNCPVQILLDYIYEKIGIDKTIEYDICEVDTAELLNIKDLSPTSYATAVMKPKQTYVLVSVERDQCGQVLGYEPLLGKQTKLWSDVVVRIKKRFGKKSTGPKVMLYSSYNLTTIFWVNVNKW